MAVSGFEQKLPWLGEGVYIHEAAAVIGDVTIAADTSIWPMAVVRGDIHAIRIGRASNIQDGAVLHVTHDSEYYPGGFPLQIGDEVTVGHGAILHGCSVHDQVLIGMGVKVLDGAVIHAQTLLAAGSLVPPGKEIEGGYLWMGSPAHKVRPLTKREKQYLRYSAEHYVRLKERYLAQ